MQNRILKAGIVAILVFVPFHALLTAWFASNYGFFDAARLWKEVLLLGLAVTVSWMVIRDKRLRAELKNDKLALMAAAFVVWATLMACFGLLSGNVGLNAAAYGLIIDTRFFVFLLITLIAAKAGIFSRKWPLYILAPAWIVIAFGLLQIILPADFLVHFGYGTETLPAFQAVDNKPELARLQSTLRGPNPLGAYLLPIIMMVTAQSLKSEKRRFLYIGTLVVALVVLYGTHSRSAWIGMAMGLGILIYMLATSKLQRRVLYVASASLVVLAASSIYILRDNDYIQNVAFHTNERSSAVTSSNEQRTDALINGVKDVARHPLGRGVGVSGPASYRNTKAPSSLSENFFIQTAQETGLIGFAMFIATFVIIVRRLMAQHSKMAAIVLASLAGVAFINMLSHALGDDTLVYVLAGMTGITLGGRISTKSENLRYTKT